MLGDDLHVELTRPLGHVSIATIPSVACYTVIITIYWFVTSLRNNISSASAPLNAVIIAVMKVGGVEVSVIGIIF